MPKKKETTEVTEEKASVEEAQKSSEEKEKPTEQVKEAVEVTEEKASVEEAQKSSEEKEKPAEQVKEAAEVTEEKASVEEAQASSEEKEKPVEQVKEAAEVTEEKVSVEEVQVPGKKEEKPVEQVTETEKEELSPKVLSALEIVKTMAPGERTGFGVSLIKGLSVLELSGWVKTLEKEFGISASAPVAVGAGSAGTQEVSAPAEEEKKDSFTVMLVSCGDKKIQVIKEVRTITSLGLREAKALVDEAPKAVKENVTEQEANEIKGKLEAAGAAVELK